MDFTLTLTGKTQKKTTDKNPSYVHLYVRRNDWDVYTIGSNTFIAGLMFVLKPATS